MAETFRKGRIVDVITKLRVRKGILTNQLEQEEFKDLEQHIKGQISAVDTIIQELAHEFDVDLPDRAKKENKEE